VNQRPTNEWVGDCRFMFGSSGGCRVDFWLSFGDAGIFVALNAVCEEDFSDDSRWRGAA
jgi:hypothetical protein